MICVLCVFDNEDFNYTKTQGYMVQKEWYVKRIFNEYEYIFLLDLAFNNVKPKDRYFVLD